MAGKTQMAKAGRLRALHAGCMLILPNAWDAGSAALIALAGAKAIATTSGGVAWSLGRPDGQRLTREEMIAQVARIVAAVTVPVTADIEGGYGPSPEDVAATVEAVIAAGAAGVNIEDSRAPGGPLFDPADQATRIQAARTASASAGLPGLFINDPGGLHTRHARGNRAAHHGHLRRARSSPGLRHHKQPVHSLTGATHAGCSSGPGYRPVRRVTSARDRGETTMKLTSHLPSADRERVEGRLHSNLIAWLTTVRPDGQPVTVPVWFLLRDDETILLYSRPEKDKLRNIAANPKVSFALDVTDIGRNIVRLEGTARRAHDEPPANQHPAYLVKYTERMAAMFGTPEQFAALFSAALIITPTKLHT